MPNLFSQLGSGYKRMALKTVGTMVLCSAIVFLDMRIVSAALNQQDVQQQAEIVKIALELLNPANKPYAIVGGKLTVGACTLDGNVELVDSLNRQLGVTVTIFRDDTRIATTVLLTDGSRATGTRMLPMLHEKVIQRGMPYSGEANVLGTKYLFSYEPLKDALGKALGAIAVGIRAPSAFTSTSSFNPGDVDVTQSLTPVCAP